MSGKNQVMTQEKKEEVFSVALSESLNGMQEALPSDFNIARFVQNSLSLLNDNTQLRNFARDHGTNQIKQGLFKAAYLGLDAMNKECYLIPYGNNLNFMIDYRGNVKLAKKYSLRPIKEIYAKIVREGDLFEEIIENGNPSINFKPKPFNSSKIIGAFAVCLYQDGGMIYDTMSLDDLENTRSSSKASNSPAWKKFTSEMYKKTVLHRLCKMIELEFDNPEQNRYFREDSEIETDEIEENANKEVFEIEETPSEVREVEEVKDDVVEVVEADEDWQKES